VKRYLLDTNVLLRFLLDDEKKLSAQARVLFQQAESGDCLLILTDLAVAEAVWVLTSFYKIDVPVVAETLINVLGKPGIHCDKADVILDTLRLFRETKCDFFDCHLAAMASVSGDGVASFDRDFRKFPDVDLWKA
jgi:predicted nucleic-acid-binding protein